MNKALSTSRKHRASQSNPSRFNHWIAFLAALMIAVSLSTATQARVPTAQPGPDAARLAGSPGKVTDDIFEVRFVEINGENIVAREFMWLEPGTYTVKVAILADMTQPRIRELDIVRAQPPEGYNVIDLEIEAGKTYHVRGRYNKDNPDMPFSTILHRVEDN